MGTKFTEEQKRAIETVDKSVLVSAAAGSGKTAVLVERIIRIILDGRANVDEMLVVTFTNAAAAEMRLRLAKAIRMRMNEHPEDAPRMKDQLARLYRAYISTIDSFALRVIREFFHRIDIEPSFGICDEIKAELLRREAIGELFEDGFADDEIIRGGSFRAFLRLYSEERSDEGFMDGMLSAYSKLRSMPDYFEWAYSKAEDLKTDPGSFEGSAIQRTMTEDALDTFGRICPAFRSMRSLFEGVGLTDLYERKLKEQEEAVLSIYSRLGSGSLSRELIDDICSIPSARLVPKKDEKETFESIKAGVKALRASVGDELKDFRNRYLVPDLDSRLGEMTATYEHTIYYLRLLEEFERRYEVKKKEQKVIDFADMEHLAVRILKDDEAADILRRRFSFIFVDEYQDTNNIQEHLISRIARPDNVFRVGDVKQSIYKFRQAEPEIFERLYARFRSGGETDGIAVDLGRNFRTNDATIKYINHVFRNIMEGYDENAMLYTGLSCEAEYDFVPEVHLLIEESGDASGVSGASEPGDSSEEEPGYAGLEDGGIEELSKEEAEAEYIAGLVDSIIGTEFYDTKARTVRKAEAGDIAILFRAVRYRGEVMSRALRERSIEPHIEDSDDYFDTVEIAVALSLLRCIDNMKKDVPLISVLHSEIFSFSPEELAEIRISHSAHIRSALKAAAESEKEEMPDSGAESSSSDPGAGLQYRRYAYWEAFAWFASEGPEGELRDKAKAASDRILEWRMLSRMLPLAEFVWKVLTDSGYYRMAGAMSGGARRQANLRYLADRAEQFSSDSVATLSSFISFVDLMKSRKLSNGQAPMAGKDDDVVRITTIHKSKGLEYPFVIVGGLGHRFRMDSNEKGFSFDSGIGVGMPYIDPSRRYWRSTMMQRAINSKSRRDAYREEMRLLYVAMTRARNRLIMVGTCKSEEDLAKYEARPASYLKAMKDVLKSGFNTYRTAPLMLSKRMNERHAKVSPKAYLGSRLSAEEQELYDEIDRRFAFRYPYEELLTEKAKYSVSEIRRIENEARSVRAEVAAHEDEAVSLTARETDALHEAADAPLTAAADTEVVSLWNSNERKKRASAADKGIAYHRIMEFLDFTKAAGKNGSADGGYIRERAEFLHSHNAIEDEVFRELDLKKIEAFFESGPGRRAVRAAEEGTLRREKPFTLKTGRDGREMLVQGVIDCCFEEDGRMVLIDYKSGFVKPGRDHETELARIRDEYRVQIELYSEAVKKGTGMEVSEAYLYLFATGEALSML